MSYTHPYSHIPTRTFVRCHIYPPVRLYDVIYPPVQSYTHPYVCTMSYIPTRTFVQCHIQCHIPTCTYICTMSYTHPYVCTMSYTHLYVCTMSYTHPYVCTMSYTHPYVHLYNVIIYPPVRTFVQCHTPTRTYICTMLHIPTRM